VVVGLGGTGNLWINGGQLLAPTATLSNGYYGTGQITISNGAAVFGDAEIASGPPASGALTIAGGSFTALADLIVGNCSTNSTGTVVVASGTIFVTNATHTAYIDVRNGTFVVSGGTLVADKLFMTNACGTFIHNGGNVSIGTMVLDPNLSATGDGLPNWWKEQYGLDPLSTNGVNGVNGDPDGDGMSNLEEFLAGTNPTNSASSLHVTSVVRTGNDVRVTWATAGGHTNVVQAAPDLSGSYSNISLNVVITGSGDTSTNYLDTGGATNGPTRFYRVRLVP
jgi:hypothetical protein